MDIIEVLKSNISEDTKRRMFDEWLKGNITPRPISDEFIENVDCIANEPRYNGYQ